MAVAKRKKEKTSRKAHLRRKGPNFKTVWASLQEVAEMQKETDRIIKENAERQKEYAEQRKEIERENAERQKEYAELRKEIERENAERQKEYAEQRKEIEREYAESRKKIDQDNEKLRLRIEKTDRIVKRNGKQMGDLHRRFGQLAEHLVAPGIAKRFNELGYHFDLVATKGAKLYDKHGKIKAETDILLENGKIKILVEVKSRPVTQDVEHHIKRLELFSDKWRLNNEQIKVLGAIAGAIFEDDVKKAVREAGLYVIEQSGDTMKIDVPEGFVPREW